MATAQIICRGRLKSIGISLLLLSNGFIAYATDWRVDVRFSEQIHPKPFSGRVYLILTKTRREPRFGPSWFNPEVFVSYDVENWKPGKTLRLSSDKTDKVLSYPKPLAEIDVAGYRGQAVVRFNPYEREIGTGEGNGYSNVVQLETQTKDSKVPVLAVDRLVQPRTFRETKWSKLLRIRSKLLSEFHGRDVFMNAAVMLPASYYQQVERAYPTIFNIPGFGGTHFGGIRRSPVQEQNEDGVEFLRVLLDPSCPLGHHVFADSVNNGPVGKALITELIPAFDQKFRSISRPTARFLRGHSSGGWSSLWLQVTYPEFFGGTWSTSPDPVDFRDFQRINLYHQGENMYVDAIGKERPLARRGRQVMLWYRGFADMEWTLGHGGQLHSFEAVFSPRGPDGKPLLLWDRQTGGINTEVAKTWEAYDIRLILDRNWDKLGAKLKGKLHVFIGEFDTFYLEGATILLKESLQKLSDDPVVEIHSGKDHGSIMTSQLRARIRREMVQAFLMNHSGK